MAIISILTCIYIPSVRDAKSDSARGGGRGRGRGGYGRGGGANRDFAPNNRDFANNENSYGNREFSAPQGAPDQADGKPYERRGGGYGGPRGSFRGGRRGGFSNGDAGEEGDHHTRRTFERRSGTGRGYVWNVLCGSLYLIFVLRADLYFYAVLR